MTLRDQLIALYAKGTVDQVHAGGAYQDLARSRETDRAFNGERDLVERMKLAVDVFLQNATTHRDQVELALRLVQSPTRTPTEVEICRELILRSYGLQWTAEQRKYFQDCSGAIAKALAYFLSFTSRNPGRPQYPNQVNVDNEWFIKGALGSDTFHSRDLIDQNLVAKAVHYYLTGRLFRGFFYPEHEQDNNVVETKLREALGLSSAFVQLVQTEIFRPENGRRNWCHYEYEIARPAGPDRIFFVVIDDIPAGGVDPAYYAWHAHVKAVDPVRLRPTRRHNDDDIDANLEAIRKKLAEQVGRAADRVFSAIPI